jgi:serine acetyltransferase
MPTGQNQIDPATRAEMAVLDAYPPEHWINLYNHLVGLAEKSHVATSTFMAHLSHAELRYLLAFLVGHDAAKGREPQETER